MGNEATIIEVADCSGRTLTVDRENGVIKGVKILGFNSRNGRTYSANAMEQARSLYEGAKVNVNHPKGNPLGPRDYQDRLGQVRNVRMESDGLFGDFHYNPRHSLASQLEWDAEKSPENVGLSHNVLARTNKHGGREVVEAITKVVSVDLVADPATNKSLFESEQPNMDEMTKLQEQVDALKADVTKLTADNAKLVEQLSAKDAEVAESARKSGIEKLFTEHKVDKAKISRGLLSIIEGSTLEQAAEAVKGLAESFAAVKVKSVGGFVEHVAPAGEHSVSEWTR